MPIDPNADVETAVPALLPRFAARAPRRPRQKSR
jgi:hypothetical protein